MVKITKEAALLYHSQGKPGKIEVVPTKPYSTQLSEVSDSYQCMVAVVSLYHALGGGREIEENTK